MISPLSGSGFCKKTVRTGLAALLVCCSALGMTGRAEASERPFEKTLPSGSASAVHVNADMLLNPALSGIPAAMSLSYRLLGYGSGSDLNHHFMLNAAGFTLSGLWMRTVYDPASDRMAACPTGLFTVNKGFVFDDVVGLGAGYTFSSSTASRFDGYGSWSFGAFLRPWRYISVGMALHDMNRPRLAGTSIPMREVYSLSVRPLYEDLTMSLDLSRRTGDDFDARSLALAASMLLYREMSLFLRYEVKNALSFGLSIPFGLQVGRGGAFTADTCISRGANGSGDFYSFGLGLTAEKYRRPVVVSKSYLRITLRDEIAENERPRLFGDTRLSFHEILGAVRDASSDAHIAGIILRIDAVRLGFAQIQELRRSIHEFREAGKPVSAVLTSASNREYYLAAAAGNIAITPSAGLQLSGLSAEVYFFRQLLEKIGVRFESVRHGKYKSFSEQFTRDRMSDEYRENLVSILSDLNEQFLSEIAEDRKLARDAINAVLKKGVLSSGEAQAAGFVDAVGYPVDAENSLSGKAGRHSFIECEDYVRSAKRAYEWGSQPAIAIVHVDGSIVRAGDGAPAPGMSRAIDDDTYCEAIEKAFMDTSVRAVIVRINSGGGSALASDAMWHCLKAIKEETAKPVIISFGPIAASGGYYIACTGDVIFAGAGTITGSIGVVSGKLSLKKLYETIGINKEVVKMSEFADIFSESRDLTPAEMEILQRGVDNMYALFTERVMNGRRIPSENIPKVAEGRVFSGRQAAGNGLVDRIGGLMAAIEYARQLAGMEPGFRVMHYPERRSPVMDLLGRNADARALPRAARIFQEALDDISRLDEETLYLYPYHILIR